MVEGRAAIGHGKPLTMIVAPHQMTQWLSDFYSLLDRRKLGKEIIFINNKKILQRGNFGGLGRHKPNDAKRSSWQ